MRNKIFIPSEVIQKITPKKVHQRLHLRLLDSEGNLWRWGNEAGERFFSQAVAPENLLSIMEVTCGVKDLWVTAQLWWNEPGSDLYITNIESLKNPTKNSPPDSLLRGRGFFGIITYEAVLFAIANNITAIQIRPANNDLAEYYARYGFVPLFRADDPTEIFKCILRLND